MRGMRIFTLRGMRLFLKKERCCGNLPIPA
nr:MAG TPA: hypothetical protein [Caudoviricetes sp.]